MFGDPVVHTIKAVHLGPNPKGVFPIHEKGVGYNLAPVKAWNNVTGPLPTRGRKNARSRSCNLGRSPHCSRRSGSDIDYAEAGIRTLAYFIQVRAHRTRSPSTKYAGSKPQISFTVPGQSNAIFNRYSVGFTETVETISLHST